MKSSKVLFLLLYVFLLVTCKKKEEGTTPQVKEDYHTGTLTIYTDDAFRSLSEAIAEVYMIHYPDSKIDVKVEKEDLAFLRLLNREGSLVVMGRDLSQEETTEFERMLDMKANPGYFAADAVVFIVPKSSSRTSIDYNDIKLALESEEKNMVFDGTNAGNLNYIAQKLDKKPNELKFSTISGNENVVKEIAQRPNRIGVVSLNTLSRPYSEKAKELRELVKVLPVVKDGKSYAPEVHNLRTQNYPFTRMVYFLTNEQGFGMANGVMRFASSQKGQMVVQKEGLQPYFLFTREVEMR